MRNQSVVHDFDDPYFRRQRFASLFGADAPLTAPSAFLERLEYRCRKSRLPALTVRDALEAKFGQRLGLRLGDLARVCEWETAAPRERAALILIDTVRHMMDASPHEPNPLERAGVLCLCRPEAWAEGETIAALLGLMDELFPRIQFVVAHSRYSGRGTRALQALRERLSAQRIGQMREVPVPVARPRVPRRGSVALVQVDGRMPNLALMKLARYLRQSGRHLHLLRPSQKPPRHLEEAYASAVFHCPATMRKIDVLRKCYGPALSLGGSGVDLSLRLPPHIEALDPDYSLYPELDGIALGFLTRGCPRRCSFCIVPRKEGPVRQVTDLPTLTEGGRRRRVILLDDNLLSLPEADTLLAQMVELRLEVNFNQTLDILRVTPTRARLLRQIVAKNVLFTRHCIHFSLNDARRLEAVAEAYALLAFTPRDSVEFVCMYGHSTTLAEDLERFRFLRSLPGAYVFVQQYRPPLDAESVSPPPFFDTQADRLLDELVRIRFPQNMKSMENYYRWASEAYYRHFGRLHGKLVDTIFRYNRRDLKGLYIAEHPPSELKGAHSKRKRI